MLLDPNRTNQCFTASPVRARQRQIRAPKKGILGGLTRVPYWDNVTVYPHNGYIAGTNPVVRRVMSLTWTLKRMRANQHAPKHATTQPHTITRNEMPSSNSVKITIHWQWPRPPARQQRKPALRSITVALKGVRRGRHVY